VAAKGVVAVADRHHGQCLCGAVSFLADGLKDIWFCHCNQCRKVTGHFMAACRTEKDMFEIKGNISWGAHSGTSELGRCTSCASPLLWRQPSAKTMSVLCGALDDTNGLHPVGHAYVDEKGGYYVIGDRLPQYPNVPTGGF
jgi:hypothetical protein